MYKTIMLDGEEIKIRTDLDEKQTGKIILDDLDITDDLSDIVNYINDNKKENEIDE